MPGKKTIIITATEQYWQESQAAGKFTRSTIDSTLDEVGFIHATFPHQTIAMLDRHFTDRDDVVLLFIDTDKLTVPLRYESASSGRPGLFPHVYGPLNIDAVYMVVKPEQHDDGTFIPPGAVTDVSEQSFICDIALMPADELSIRATDLSDRLFASDTYFRLSSSGPFPHVSVYNMVRLRVSDIESLNSAIKNITSGISPFELRADRYEQSYGYLDANYVRTAALEAFQMRIVDAINPLRNGLREKDEKQLLQAKGVLRENLKKYGFRGAGSLFRPHLTLTRYAGDKVIDVAFLPPVESFNGVFCKLGVFEVGDHGTCIRKFHEFILGGKE